MRFVSWAHMEGQARDEVYKVMVGSEARIAEHEELSKPNHYDWKVKYRQEQKQNAYGHLCSVLAH
jgi:hypothetical protein